MANKMNSYRRSTDHLIKFSSLWFEKTGKCEFDRSEKKAIQYLMKLDRKKGFGWKNHENMCKHLRNVFNENKLVLCECFKTLKLELNIDKNRTIDNDSVKSVIDDILFNIESQLSSSASKIGDFCTINDKTLITNERSEIRKIRDIRHQNEFLEKIHAESYDDSLHQSNVMHNYNFDLNNKSLTLLFGLRNSGNTCFINSVIQGNNFQCNAFNIC